MLSNSLNSAGFGGKSVKARFFEFDIHYQSNKDGTEDEYTPIG